MQKIGKFWRKGQNTPQERTDGPMKGLTGVKTGIQLFKANVPSYGVGMRFRFEPKSRSELKYFSVHMSHLGPN